MSCGHVEGPEHLATTTKCPGCGGEDNPEFFVAEDVPADVGSTLASEWQARAAPRGDIVLVYCHGCGLIWNRAFDSSCVAFRPGYAAGLHYSARIQSFTDRLVDRLIGRFELRQKEILEIGCGSGHLLRRLCEQGGNSGLGVDPAVALEGTEHLPAGRVEFIREFYSRKHLRRSFDFICLQSVLEDIPQPLAFLSNLRLHARGATTAIYCEVFNAGAAFELSESWSVHYEQCNYFSLSSLQRLFTRTGFDVLDAGVCAGNDQYLYLEARLAKDSVLREQSPSRGTVKLPPTLAELAARHHDNVTGWRTHLHSWRAQNRRVALWGSGGKGISFLNAMGAESGIPYVVDINPHRQGRFIPGSAQQIVPPSFLNQWRPDVVIIANSAYLQEIRETMNGLGVNPDLYIVSTGTQHPT